ncbi:hypothetical protein, partial [Pectobacterium parmentieri]|uniref:hypothetical protein n=1 Tax=Pectobacterium parmentieri TaxID=1905730 RepID=UPI002B2552D2
GDHADLHGAPRQYRRGRHRHADGHDSRAAGGGDGERGRQLQRTGGGRHHRRDCGVGADRGRWGI